MLTTPLELITLLASADYRSSTRFVGKEVFTMGCIEIDIVWINELTCTRYSDCHNDIEWDDGRRAEHIDGNVILKDVLPYKFS